MYQPLFTHFIKNRIIQFSMALSIYFNIIIAKSIKQTLILFGLPYLISVLMCFRFKPRKRIKARISKQYRNTTT